MPMHEYRGSISRHDFHRGMGNIIRDHFGMKPGTVMLLQSHTYDQESDTYEVHMVIPELLVPGEVRYEHAYEPDEFEDDLCPIFVPVLPEHTNKGRPKSGPDGEVLPGEHA